MTEEEFVRLKNYGQCVRFLAERFSERKFRLYACAVGWRLQSADAVERAGLAVAERFADDQATFDEVQQSLDAILREYAKESSIPAAACAPTREGIRDNVET